MHAVFADPKTDFVFKRIFGSEGRKPLLVSLLNHLLELDGDRSILDVQHLSGDQHVDVADLKLSIVDVKCTDATGRRFVVEMQVFVRPDPHASRDIGCGFMIAGRPATLAGD